MTESVSIGKLAFSPVLEHLELIAPPVRECILNGSMSKFASEIFVAPIDPNFTDTAEFCTFYEIGLEVSANTIVVEAKRGDRRWWAMCNILANTRADINKTVRKDLDAKAASFAPMDFAVEKTGMEYGGIGPIGAPDEWPFLIDSRVLEPELVVIGSGIRGSKIAVSGNVLSELPTATVLESMATPIEAL